MAFVNSIIPPFPDHIDRVAFGNWIAGFTDAEGCFNLHVTSRGSRGSLNFSIELRGDDREVLELIQSYFGVGSMGSRSERDQGRTKPQSSFTVSGTDNLLKSIVPHFQQHRLRAKKSTDFQIWVRGIEISREVSSFKRVYRPNDPINGYFQGIEKKWDYSHMSEYTKLCELLKETRKFNENRPLANCVDETPEDYENFGHWISGFSDGEACFQLLLVPGNRTNDKDFKVGSASFSIKLRSDDISVLSAIKDRWRSGEIYVFDKRTPTSNPSANYLVNHCQHLATAIIPHFDSFPLRSKKSRDFEIWKKAVFLLAEIKSRPTQCRGRAIGRKPKWTERDVNEFTELYWELRNTRKYK